MKIKTLSFFSCQFFIGSKDSQPDFLLSKSSRLKASSLIIKHLVGAVGTAEKTVGEGKQFFKKSDINNNLLVFLCSVAVVRLTGLDVSEIMLVQRRNGV